MTELHQRYRRAKESRARAIMIGLVIGTVGGAFVAQDAGMAILSGLITALVIGIGKSIEVNSLEKIIYPGGKR